jgi:beta-N-acetylhexosaminidase
MEQHSNEQDRRNKRRTKRIRAQIAAYAVLFCMLSLLTFGIVVGINWISQRTNHQNQTNPSTETENTGSSGIIVTLPSTSTEEEPTETVNEPTPQELLDEMLIEMIQEMPIADRVAGLFFVTPEDITGVGTVVQAADGTRNALAQYPVGGLIYNKKNLKSTEQVTTMLANTKEFSLYPIFLGLDEEGGTVSRLDSSGLAQGQSGADDIAASGDPNNATQAGVAIGATLQALGFNVDFAPVADLANIENSIMMRRSYGADAMSAIPYVTAMMNGLQDQGVVACLKHFPGLGSTTSDTHNELSVSERTAEQFRAEEFLVFQAGIDAGAQMIMVGHMAAPALVGDNTPSSLSEIVVTDILRDEMGYEGVIITDSLAMKAISDYYESGDAAIRALRAGCDMILMPEDFNAAYQAVLEAVADGMIDQDRINDSLLRIYRIKYKYLLETISVE